MVTLDDYSAIPINNKEYSEGEIIKFITDNIIKPKSNCFIQIKTVHKNKYYRVNFLEEIHNSSNLLVENKFVGSKFIEVIIVSSGLKILDLTKS